MAWRSSRDGAVAHGVFFALLSGNAALCEYLLILCAGAGELIIFCGALVVRLGFSGSKHYPAGSYGRRGGSGAGC